MTEPAQLGAGNLVITNLGWGEVHVNSKPRYRVLLEAEGRNKEAVNHIHRAKSQINFAIYRQIHSAGDDVVLCRGIRRIQPNRGFASCGWIHQLGVGAAILSVGSRISEVPGELHSGDLDRNRVWSGWGKTFACPHMAPHQVQPYKEDGRKRRPKHFELGIPVGVLNWAVRRTLAVLPHKISEGTLCRDENDSHQDERQGELTINERRCLSCAMW